MSAQLPNPVLPLIPQSPIRPDIYTYTLFITRFEPFEYTDWIDESMSWKETCYIGDWSPLGKFNVKGPDALKYFSSLAVNSFTKFETGQAKHLILCNNTGKLMGEGILSRFAEDDFLFTSGPGLLWAEYMFRKGNYNATGTRIGSFIFQVQGPNSLFVLEKVTGESLRDINFMRFRKTKINGKEIRILRQGMSGELGYELTGPSEYGVEIYNAILEAGREFGIRRLGGRAKMVNHVEACYPTPTVDYMPAFLGEDRKDFLDYLQANASFFLDIINENGKSLEDGDISSLYRSPVEMGWAKNIKFDHEFLGHEALEKEVKNPKRNMVTLVWNSDDVIDVFASLFKKGGHYQYMEMPRNLLNKVIPNKVMKNGKVVGITTSRCYSFYFREMLSLCTMDVDLCIPGTEVTVIWGDPGKPQKEIRAMVAPAPYKSDRRRIDVKVSV